MRSQANVDEGICVYSRTRVGAADDKGGEYNVIQRMTWLKQGERVNGIVYRIEKTKEVVDPPSPAGCKGEVHIEQCIVCSNVAGVH